jgi:hypothetical protein
MPLTLREDPIASVMLSCVARALRIHAVTFLSLSLVGCPKRSRGTSSSSSCPPLCTTFKIRFQARDFTVTPFRRTGTFVMLKCIMKAQLSPVCRHRYCS